MIFLGISKGGFSSVGIAATPLLALYLPPLEAAALLLPILLRLLLLLQGLSHMVRG